MADWQAGDLALCIVEGSWIPYGVELRRGQIHQVIAVLGVHEVEPVGPSLHECYLEFAQWSPDNTFGCRNFVKVTPGTPDAEDAETIRLMTGQPVQVEV